MSAVFTKYQTLLKQYRALQPLPAVAQSTLDKKFRLEFNFNSNHIEGNTLTYAETELLLIFDGTKGNHELREYEEMKAHDVAWHLVQEWAKSDRLLTEAEIKELNQVILVRPFWKDAITPDGQTTRRLIQVGDYKEYPNSVRLPNGEIFEYASVIDTPIKMGELIHWFQAALQSAELDPVLIAARLHYDFVRIHPFDDGNGRISRLLMNYVLVRHDLPPVIIKSKDKAAYLRALNRADVGDFEAFVDYVVEQMNWSLELCLKASRGESIEEEDDLDKEIEVLNRRLKGTNIEHQDLKLPDLYENISVNITPFFASIFEKFLQLSDLFDNLVIQQFYFLDHCTQVSSFGKESILKEFDAEEDKHLITELILKYRNHKCINFRIILRNLKSSTFKQSFKTEIKLAYHLDSLEVQWLEHPEHCVFVKHGENANLKLKTLLNEIVRYQMNQIQSSIS